MQNAANGTGRAARTLLLDVDGVVFRNKRALSVVSNRVVEYVRARANVGTYWEAKKINEIAYAKYGHTMLGLADMCPELDLSVRDFNDFVYERSVIAAAAASIGFDPYDRAPEDARRFLRYCDDVGVETYLFTNAPSDWVRMVRDVCGLEFGDDRILSTDDLALHRGEPALKPTLASFAHVGKRLRERGDDARVFFVDDSAANCFMSQHYMGWPTHKFEEGRTLSVDVAKWLGV